MAADGGDEELPRFVEVALVSGERATGELVVTYDQHIWWHDPADLETYALFSPDLYAVYPEDRSFRFIHSSSVAFLTEASFPRSVAPYRRFARDERIVISEVPLDGVAYLLTGHESYHLEEDGYGDFAYDLVRTDEVGNRFIGDGLLNEDYLVWDSAVYLPTSGYVVEVVRDAPDNEPGSYEREGANNMIGVHIKGSFYLYLLHFRQDTIPASVRSGAYLYQGSYVGRVGNSGVSAEPHLHIALLWFDESAIEPRTWSVPIELADLWQAPSPDGPASLEYFSRPLGGVWISSESF